MDSADLEHELLGACLKADIGTNHEAQMLANAERPFYELGKIYSVQYLKKPQAIFTSPELKDIRKKVFGYLCAKIGEAWYEEHEEKFMSYVMSKAIFLYTPAKWKDDFNEEFVGLLENIRDAYFNALSDFSIGFWEGATKETYKRTVDMLFWFLPDNNVAKFDKLRRKPDVLGMVSQYHDYSDEIDKAHNGAEKFIEFVESSVTK
jgi:hypothetical protein